MEFDNIIKLISYFIVYSFLGWVLESVFKTIEAKKIINSGFLHGPFCPIYGTGAIIMYISLSNYTLNPIIIFFIGFIVLSVWEYIVGWLLEKAFNTKYWDYSENKFNIRGRVCLMNSIFWGILGAVFIYYVHPFISDSLDKLPSNIIASTTIILSLIMFVDAIISIIKVRNIEIRIVKLSEIGDNLRERLAELSELREASNNKTLENIQEIIEDLKLQQTKLKNKVLKQTNRLRKAFPTMKSERISEFLNNNLRSKDSRKK